MWEFGSSTRSQVVLKTSATGKSEQFVFTTQAGSNRISAQIVPGKGGYWPKNGDWRASFTSGPLDGSTASFSADNDRVSAQGSLIPATITVTGVDIDGQWLRYATTAGGERKWQLAHASPRGGYIVEQVTRTIFGTRADGSPITPSSDQLLAGMAGSGWIERSSRSNGQLRKYGACRQYWGRKHIRGGAVL